MSHTDQLSLCRADNAVLLVIDLQGKLFSLIPNHPQIQRRVEALLRLAALFETPTLLTEQYPGGLGPTDAGVLARFEALTGERHRVEKTSFGCCGEPGFSDLLANVAARVRQCRAPAAARRPVDVVVAGVEAHVCVHQTVMELLQQPQYRVVLLQDAVGSRDESYRQMALRRFQGAGVLLSNLESLAFEWTRSKDHPHFKAMSAIIKEASA